MHSGFNVNDYITLKLEGEDTNIYIRGEYFRQCKYLLLNIPITQVSSFEDIKSIDEASERLDHTLDPVMDEEGNIYRIDRIPPEVEFWGHCSNLQVWYEHDYDTRLLHRNLAFPLLKKLTEEGDPLAKKVFKSELAKRIDIGNKNVIKYLILERYIDFLEFEELEVFTDFQPFIDSFSSLLEEEFLNVYVKALKKHGMKFQFLRKNEEAFPVAFSLQRMRDKSLGLLKNILEKIIIQASYNSMLYLQIEGYFYILDYQNFTESINSHIIKELSKGVSQNSEIVFTQAFLMLISLSFGTHEERDSSLSRRFRLKDNLHLKKNLSPNQYTSLINNITKRLILYYDDEEYRFHHEAICDFLSSFGEYAVEGLTYILKRASGELKSIAQKCLVQIKTENPSIENVILPKVDINIDTILRLNSKEIKTLLPSNTGEILVERVLLQFYNMPRSNAKWDLIDALYNFFEKIGKDGEIQIGNGVMKILAKRDLELTELLIELKILEYLTEEEATILVQNLNFVRDLLKILEKQEHFESKSEYMNKLSRFFEKLKGNIDKSLETKLRCVFDEFPSSFQNNVVKLHLLTFPTIEDLTKLFQHRITDLDLIDYNFINLFFRNLVSNKDLIENFLFHLYKDQNPRSLEGVLNSAFLHYIDKKDLLAFKSEILEDFIPFLKRFFKFKEMDESEEIEDSYYDNGYSWDYHEKIEYLEKIFNEVNEIKSLISLPKKDFKDNFILLESLMKKKYLQYIKRDQFWNIFPKEASYLRQVEDLIKKPFNFYPNYRIDSPTEVRDLGFSLKDNIIFFIGIGHFKLTSKDIHKILKIILNLSSIERLELNHNQFTNLPDFIANFKNLKYLILTYAGLRSVPETIGDMSNLIHLALNYNNLTTLPETIGNLKLLQSMYLNHNSELKYLPESIGELKNLKSLLLSQTGLKNLPESFCNLKSLGSLRIEGSQISELPDSIGEMTALSGIYLAETPIKRLPDSIGSSKSIKTIDISRTQLSYLPESIKNIDSLEEIIVSKSYMKNLPTLRRLMAPLRKKEVQILFKDRTLPSSFVYFTNKLEGDKPYSKQLY